MGILLHVWPRKSWDNNCFSLVPSLLSIHSICFTFQLSPLTLVHTFHMFYFPIRRSLFCACWLFPSFSLLRKDGVKCIHSHFKSIDNNIDDKKYKISLCSFRKYPYSPTEGIGISLGVGGYQRPKNLSECMKLDWNFQRGGESKEKSLPWGRYG